MKKIISIVLVITLIFGTVSVVFAGTTQANGKISLEKAIEIAREAFNFNTEGFDFNQSYYENMEGIKQWQLNWNSRNNGNSISIAIDADTGDILNMYQWKDEFSTTKKLAKYSEEEALKMAETIIKKLQPERFKEMELVENNNYNYRYIYDSNSYNFYFIRKVDNIKFQGDGVNISINKNTLEVNSYTFNWSKVAFPDVSKAISLEEAKKIFKEKNGIELAYIFKYDQKTKKNTAKLVYTLKNGNRPIDAITGEVINQVFYPLYDAAASGEVQVAKEAVVLTPEEMKEVENNNKYLKKEEAIEIAKKYVKIDEKHKMEAASLYPNYNSEGAIWNFSWSYNIPDKKEYSYINISLDAATGEVINLSNYNSNQDVADNSVPKYNFEKSKELAESFLNAIVPEKFAQSEYRPDPYENNMVDKPILYNFKYVRMVNGIACPGNYLIVTVNTYTGDITSFYSVWTDIEFPKADNPLTLEEAYEALFKNAEFSLSYVNYYDYRLKYPYNKIIRLVYSFDSFSGLFDPKTGELLDYNGDVIKDIEDYVFEDIKGHWAENDIMKLLEAGIIGAASKAFAPDQNIKQKDFIKMLINSLQPNYRILPYDTGSSEEEYDDYYKQAISRKIITEKEKNPDSEITRVQAAKMFIKAMNLGYLADKSDIFALNYKDNEAISKEMRGYVAIISGLNIMSGKEGGIFAPEDKLTRAETAATLVRFLEVDRD